MEKYKDDCITFKPKGYATTKVELICENTVGNVIVKAYKKPLTQAEQELSDFRQAQKLAKILRSFTENHK